jgi:hypothetical protein
MVKGETATGLAPTLIMRTCIGRAEQGRPADRRRAQKGNHQARSADKPLSVLRQRIDALNRELIDAATNPRPGSGGQRCVSLSSVCAQEGVGQAALHRGRAWQAAPRGPARLMVFSGFRS